MSGPLRHYSSRAIAAVRRLAASRCRETQKKEGTMLIIAERINASRKGIAAAIAAGDRAFIQEEAKAQAAAGAHYIDVNAGTFIGEEEQKLRWIVEAVQEVTDLPLSIDSPDPAVIAAMMPLVKKTPMINSITLEPSRIEGILPLVVTDRKSVV